MAASFTTENLVVGYHNTPLIRDICLSVQAGQILALIGPNGSGKSTILKSITRHLATLGGVVSLSGQDIQAMAGKELATKLAVVLTDRIRPDLMTCREVVETGRYPYSGYFGHLSSTDHAAVTTALSQVNALDLSERDFSAISDGQRQRVMLARALCQQPQVIVLDEPTSFLDIHHKLELLNILRSMAREGLIVVMSLHEIDLAAKVADIVACVHGDTITQMGTPEHILTTEAVNALYDLPKGAYNVALGSVELPRTNGAPQVFVLAGNGCGIPYYRLLQRLGIPFATGILHENDIDFHVGNALAQETWSASAFCPIDEALLTLALHCLRQCSILVHSGVPIGVYNAQNADILHEAKRCGIPVVDSSAGFLHLWLAMQRT